MQTRPVWTRYKCSGFEIGYIGIGLARYCKCSGLGAAHRLNMKLDLQSCTHWLRHRNPPPPRIWAHIRGLYWSAKIDDISLWPPGFEIGCKCGEFEVTKRYSRFALFTQLATISQKETTSRKKQKEESSSTNHRSCIAGWWVDLQLFSTCFYNYASKFLGSPTSFSQMKLIVSGQLRRSFFSAGF